MLHDVVFASCKGPGGRSQFGSSAQEGLNDGCVPTADGPIQRSHPVQVDMLQNGTFLQQDLQ